MAPKASREAGGLGVWPPLLYPAGLCRAGRTWLQRPGGCRSPNEREVRFSPGSRTHTEHHRFSLWAQEISPTHPGPAPVISRVPKRRGCGQADLGSLRSHPGSAWREPAVLQNLQNRVRIAPAAR